MLKNGNLINVVWTFCLKLTHISSHVLGFQKNLSVKFLKEPFFLDVTYGQVWWPILGICALHLPIQSAHTQQWAHTHPEQWAAIYAAAHGEQLGVRCLAQGHLSRGIEGGESAGHSLPPPTIPAGPRLELATFRLRVCLSYESDSLN